MWRYTCNNRIMTGPSATRPRIVFNPHTTILWRVVRTCWISFNTHHHHHKIPQSVGCKHAREGNVHPFLTDISRYKNSIVNIKLYDHSIIDYTKIQFMILYTTCNSPYQQSINLLSTTPTRFRRSFFHAIAFDVSGMYLSVSSFGVWYFLAVSPLYSIKFHAIPIHT